MTAASTAAAQDATGIRIDVGHTALYSLSCLQSALPLIRHVSVSNAHTEALDGVVLRCSASVPLFPVMEYAVASIPAQGTYKLASVALNIDEGYLARCVKTEVIKVYITVLQAGKELLRQCVSVSLLPATEWSGLTQVPQTLAAFVTPEDAALADMVGGAVKKAFASKPTDTFDIASIGYTQGQDGVRALVQAFWDGMVAQGITCRTLTADFATVGHSVASAGQVIAAKGGNNLDVSLMWAACFERCGLHPLLVFVQGHVVLGCWLQDETFSTSVIDDAMVVRQQLQARNLCLFSAESLVAQGPMPSFAQSCTQAVSWLAEDQAAQFLGLIDVAQARIQGVQPLVRQPDGRALLSKDTAANGTGVADAVPPSVSAAPRPMTKLEQWQRNLLDLSLRNPLLNFRAGKRFVELVVEHPHELEDALTDGANFSFAAGLDQLSKDTDKADASINEQLLPLAKELFAQKRLVVPLHRQEMDSRLLGLFRAARAALEEGGANVLYLAAGFLSWREKGRPTPCKAPLILIPVRLERRSVQSGFSLSMYDEEARFNLTLLELLRREHGLRALDVFATELPVDAHGLDVQKIWETVRQAVKDIPGWEVSSMVGLGLFSFAKYLMWKDLQAQGQLEQRNDVIRQLLHPELITGGDKPFFDARALDDTLPMQKTYCPMLADGSQLAAVATAARGQSFVLIGPPGTGKSQTITNMIAQCLGEGKTVLFVAEKAAALNVVHRRLSKSGLGAYCLELHSSKMRKVDVLRQLHDAVSVNSEFSQNRWIKDTEQLQKMRTKLNEYVRQLHKEYPNGLTIYSALGTVLQNASVPKVDLRWNSPKYHDANAYATLFEASRKLELYAGEAAQLRTTAVAYIAHADFSPVWQQELLDATRQAQQAAAALQETSVRLTAVLPSFAPLMTVAQVEKMRELCDSLPAAYGADWRFISRADGATTIAALEQGLTLVQNIQEEFKALSAPCQKEAVVAQLATADIAAAHKALEEEKTAWWPKSSMLRRTAEKILLPLYASGGKPDLGADVPHWLRLQSLVKDILQKQELKEKTGGLWRGIDTAPATVQQAVRLGKSVHACTSGMGTDVAAMQAFMADMERILGAGNMLLAPGGEYTQVLAQWLQRASIYSKCYDAWAIKAGKSATPTAPATDDAYAAAAAQRAFAAQADVSPKDALNSMDFAQLQEVCQGLLTQEKDLMTWCSWLRMRKDADAQGLRPLVDAALEGLVPVDMLSTAFTVNYARWWVLHAIEDVECLKCFSAREHQRTIDDYRTLDESIRLLTSGCVCANMPERSALMAAVPQEWAILKKQMTLKKRHMPLRQLLSSVPTLLGKLTPCFLMSPLSIAQYLEAGQHQFDVVIFDEASQIPIWDALGAMAHGKHVIVVGDQKQLPPTSFFQRSEDGDADESSPFDVDLESILDQCVGSNLPLMHLRWHYRSRNEGLITFSNQQYYEGCLVTFPAPRVKDCGVHWHYVEGIYERGTSRTNPQEAKVLVAHIVQSLREQQRTGKVQTIGVVTFNIQQQTLIEDLLEAERRQDPSLERFFSTDNEEPVMVKNLESVQGDERDVMYFSIGFGKDASGGMNMNFGALNKDGGERRLNVAITRARIELRVFASIHAEQISLSATKARGVHDLRLFLDYAERGPVVLSGLQKANAGDFGAPFEAFVAERLRAKGWQVQGQVGISSLRIDLAVLDPDGDDAFLAGIECDGKTYQGPPTARDRDRLRESVLCGLGWDILRAWSIDWWLQPDAAADKLDAALREIQKKRRAQRAAQAEEQRAKEAVAKSAPEATASGDASATPTTPVEGTETSQTGASGPADQTNSASGTGSSAADAAPQTPSAPDLATAPGQAMSDTAPTALQAPSVAPSTAAAGNASVPAPAKPLSAPKTSEMATLQAEASETFDKVEDTHRAKIIADIIAGEYPIHEDRLCALYMRATQVTRLGAKAKKAVLECAQAFPVTKEDVGIFYWQQGTSPADPGNVPQRHGEERKVTEVCMPELRAIARTIYDDGIDDPVLVFAQHFGLQRPRGGTRERLEKAWKSRYK